MRGWTESGRKRQAGSRQKGKKLKVQNSQARSKNLSKLAYKDNLAQKVAGVQLEQGRGLKLMRQRHRQPSNQTTKIKD